MYGTFPEHPDSKIKSRFDRPFTYRGEPRRGLLRLLEPISITPDHLAFRLVQLPRSKESRYIAISYAWGTEPATREIWIDNCFFPVRQNLWSCLYHLCRAKLHSSHEHITPDWSYLWVDAICINQDNASEKAEQVRSMNLVYTRALYVASWLGMPRYPDKSVFDPHEAGLGLADAAVREWRREIADLGNREYWRRRWVIQEFLLGEDVWMYWGNEMVHWKDFKGLLMDDDSELEVVPVGTDGPVSLLLRCHRHVDMEDPDREYVPPSPTSRAKPIRFAALPLLRARHIDRQPEITFPLDSLLIEHRHALCNDPRDRIFALLGLVDFWERSHLQRIFPSYHLSHEHVAILVLAHCNQTGPMDRMTIEAEHTEVFEGLGLEGLSLAKREELLRRAEEIDYTSPDLYIDSAAVWLDEQVARWKRESEEEHIRRERDDGDRAVRETQEWYQRANRPYETLVDEVGAEVLVARAQRLKVARIVMVSLVIWAALIFALAYQTKELL